MLVCLNVNGKDYTVDVEPDEKLLDTLRERLHITSVKRGCENGDCGACTVLMNGYPVDSCIFLTLKARGQKVQTIEAFGQPGALHPIQEKLKEHGAFQCGFCAPGAVLSLKMCIRDSVVDRHPLIGNAVLLDRRIHLDVLNELGNHAFGDGDGGGY